MRIIFLIRKTNVPSYNIVLLFVIPLFHEPTIKDLGVYIDCKLYFRNHVDFIFSHTIKLLGEVQTISTVFPTC
jgi:hypothetical protein